VSRRRRRAEGAGQAEGAAREERGGAAPPQADRAAATAPAKRGSASPQAERPPGRAPYRIRPLWQVAILVGVFAVVTLIAELAGAASLGVALGIGQIAFGIALVVVLVRS
jgi:hypothetical protein